MILLGTAIGLITALACSRVWKSLLFSISARDPLTFALVTLLLIGVALLASLIPARSATRIDPMEALRYD